MSGQVFGVALNPQNLFPVDLNVSTSVYTTLTPPYQNISSGSYTLWINTLSDTIFQTRDRGQIITSNFSYSTVALSLFGSSNNQFIFQNMRDYNYFPLVTRYSPFNSVTNAIAWNGSVFVAVGSGSNNIATSTDGLAWVPRDFTGSGSIFSTRGAFSVTWNTMNSNWIVGGSNAAALSNIIAISRDNGTTWTGVTSYYVNGGSGTIMSRPAWSSSPPLAVFGHSNSSSGIVYSSNLTNYLRNDFAGTFWSIAWNGVIFMGTRGGGGTGGQIALSYDGITWSLFSLALTGNFTQGVAWSPTLGIWVVTSTTSTSGQPVISYSYDGRTWTTAISSLTTEGFLDVIWTGTQFVAVGTASGSRGCFTSANGISWTSQATSIFTTQANSIAFSPTLGVYVAVGIDTTHNIATSTNLSSWTKITGLTIFSSQGTSVAWSSSLSMFVAVGSGTNSIAYSYDGTNWTGLGLTPNTFTTAGYGILWITELGLWVATGSGTNSVLTSPDGITWTNRSSTGVDSQIRGIDWSSVQNQYVMVGIGSHRIATSSDGIIWIGRTGSTIFSTQANAVIWVPTLSIWVALGQGTNTIATSPDGINWTGRGTSIFSTAGLAIDYNGSIFVAGGQGTNTIATSTDGIIWTGRGATAITTSTRGVAWSPTLRLWVVSGSGTNSFATSTDGVTWTARTGTSIFSTAGETVEWSTQLNTFVAGGSGTNTLATSPDGINWTGTNLLNSLCTNIFSIAWNGSYWVAGGTGTNTIVTSVDGINWVGRGTPVTTTVFGVAWNGSLWVAVGSGTNRVATSVDGITWISRGAVAHNTNQAVIWYAYKSCWIALGDSTSAIFTSPDGVTWTSRTIQTNTTSRCIASTPTGFLVLGGTGTNRLQTSPDGTTWTARTSPISTSVNSVAFSPSLNIWVAVGSGTHTIATSTDATTWTGRGTSIFSIAGLSVVWNGNFFIATGSGTNNVATSADGITWRANTQQSATGVIYTSGLRYPLMVAGGTGTNTICTSDDNGLTWRPRFTSGTQINTIAWNGYIWVAGSSGTGLYTSPDGISWTARTSLFTSAHFATIWSDSLKLWVMGGSGTWSIQTSPDGVIWTGRSTAGTGNILQTCVALAWSGSRFVAIGAGTNNTVMISSNGINWTGVGIPITATAAWGGVDWNGLVFVAANEAATNIWSSPDGIIWSSRYNLLAGTCRDVMWNGRQFLVVGTSTAYALSRDGVNWTAGTGTLPFGTGNVRKITWNSVLNQWAIVGDDSSINNVSIATSTDAITWVPRMTYTPMTATVNSFAWSSTLGLWVAVGSTTAMIVSSADGVNWIQRDTTFTVSGNGVAWNGSLFVAVGGTSTTKIMTSTDGITWTSRASGGLASITQMNGVAWASSLNLWVAVGTTTAPVGIIASSTDGINWTSRNTSIFTTAANAVAWNGSLFVAVGQGTNVFATSTDGLSWTARGATGITTAGRGVVWATAPGVTSQWVAVGSGTNSIATSTDGVTWVGRTTTAIFSTQGNQVANNGFTTVATGTGTNSYAWSYDNGTTWTGGGATAFGTQGLGIAWNSNTGQWVGGASNAPYFLSSSDGINWISRQNFTTSAFSIASETREKTFVINNSNWTGRTSQQTFRIIG